MTDLPSERARLLRLTLAPAALIAVLGGAALAAQDLAAPAAGTSRAVGLAAVGAFAVLAVVVLALAARRARRAERELRRQQETREALVRDWVAHYSAAVAAARGDLRGMLQQVLHGQRPDQPAAPAPVTPGDGFAALDQELRLLHHEAAMAVLHASAHQQVEVFVNIARRLQSLVTRSLQELDALEGEVEDPELLGGLLRVDHLGTRLRRHVESLAVLGGATPRRIGRPVAVYTVLRQALSEIEQYARVKILRPVEGTLKGHVVTDVIHLVAELIENATNFSRPETQVHVRAQLVAAGLAIEIDDRGLGIPLEERDRLERLLTRPDLVDLGEQLKDGRIGLFVVARLAQRHGIAVRAQSNIYGGTQSVVVVPHALLESEPAAAPAPTPRQAPVPAGDLPRRQAAAAASAGGPGRSAAGTWRGDESGTPDWPTTPAEPGADAPVIDWTGSGAWQQPTHEPQPAHGLGADSPWTDAPQPGEPWSEQQPSSRPAPTGGAPLPTTADATSAAPSWPQAQPGSAPGNPGAAGGAQAPATADAASGGRAWNPIAAGEAQVPAAADAASAAQSWASGQPGDGLATAGGGALDRAAADAASGAQGWSPGAGDAAPAGRSWASGQPGDGLARAGGALDRTTADAASGAQSWSPRGASGAVVPVAADAASGVQSWSPGAGDAALAGRSWASGQPGDGLATAGGALDRAAADAASGGQSWSPAPVERADAGASAGGWAAGQVGGQGLTRARASLESGGQDAGGVGARWSGEPVASPGTGREALPVRPRPGTAAPEASAPQAWDAPAAGGAWTPGGATEHGGSGERPPLPRRTGSYLVPELRDRIARPDAVRPGPTPDLMARFSLGQQRAEDPDQ